MNTKNNIIVIIALVLIILGIYWYATSPVVTPVADNSVEDSGRIASPQDVDTYDQNLQTETFSGKIEEVNVGCFVDGECYVVVDGKHVTVVMGWSQEVVGSVVGVESFGELSDHIGEEAEVYAQKKTNGNYSLYGSANFYVKLK